MGEAADDMLDGSCCSSCGEWFEEIFDGVEPPGYPRVCDACGDGADED